jgi:hypothetical protein
MDGHRVLLYDRTCREIAGWLGLSAVWRVGGWWFRARGRFDRMLGIASWTEGLHALADLDPARPLDEVQYWGHGNWGSARAGNERLSVESLRAEHPHRPLLEQVRRRHRDDGGTVWWFRTCETLGREAGHRFARSFATEMNATVAGHTFIIAWAQSGLHCLAPGQEPDWSSQEGLRSDGRAQWSRFRGPRTIPFWRQEIPNAWRPAR